MSQPDSSLSLQGKVALVTGSGKTRGIGAAIAALLARHGASVVLNYVSPSTGPSAAGVAERIVAAGGKALVVQADISRPEEAQRLVQETVTAFGQIDILGESMYPRPWGGRWLTNQSTMPPPVSRVRCFVLHQRPCRRPLPSMSLDRYI